MWEYKGTQLTAYTNENGLRVQFFYDGAGRKTLERAEDRQISFSYDSLGLLEKTHNGAWTTVQTHNVEGLIEETWEEDQDGNIENRMRFHYNNENQKERVERTTSQGEAVDFLTYTDGKLTGHKDPLGNQTRITYNPFFKNELGQNTLQKTTIDPLDHQTIETFDAQNRLIQREKKDPSAQTVFKETFSYDRSGNLAKHLSFVYRENLPEKEIMVERTFDSMGRLIEEVESGQKKSSFSYDSRGNLISKILPDQVELSYVYDGANRLQEISSSDRTVHYSYVYSQGLHPIEIIDSLQNVSLKRSYNSFGQVTSEVNFLGQAQSWSYDSQGRCLSMTLPDHSSIEYQYKGAHMNVVQRKDPYGHLLYQHQYLAFDPNGHIAEESLICNLGHVKTSRDLLERPSTQTSSYFEQTMTYDPSGRVEKVSHSFLGNKEYEYDSLSQLTRENDTPYAFDSLGNPIDCEVNELNQICRAADTCIQYDPNGNPIEQVSPDQTTQYTYDALGRLIAITIDEHKKVCFSYDPCSRLFSKEVYSSSSSPPWYQPAVDFLWQEPSAPPTGSWKKEQEVYYLYDRDREIGTFDAQGRLHELKVLGLGIKGDIGAAISIELGGIPYAPLHDFQGNIIAILSPSGAIEETYHIDSFGRETGPPPQNPWRFASKRSEEGLIFFGLRFYDPNLGRWLTPDPAGLIDGVNLYAYVHNSPLNRLDLFGLFEENFLQAFKLDVPIPQIPSFAGIQSFMAQGEINGIVVDFFLSCGHWHQLQFTPEEQQIGRVNLLDHLPELVATSGLYVNICTLNNGINTTLPEFKDMCSALTKKTGGTFFIGLHTPTEGVLSDIKRVQTARKGIETKQTSLNRQFMVTIGEKVHNINPQSIWYAIGHSEGGLIMKRAIEGMDEGSQNKLRSLLHILAIAPAEPLSKKQGAAVMNIYSDKDYVTGFGPQGQVPRYLNHPDYKIEILKCSSPIKDRNFFIADHGFLKPTYTNAWQGNVSDKQKEFTFYQGEHHDAR